MTWVILMFLAFVGFCGYCVWDVLRLERRLNGRA